MAVLCCYCKLAIESVEEYLGLHHAAEDSVSLTEFSHPDCFIEAFNKRQLEHGSIFDLPGPEGKGKSAKAAIKIGDAVA